jgi:hypothetical protein
MLCPQVLSAQLLQVSVDKGSQVMPLDSPSGFVQCPARAAECTEMAPCATSHASVLLSFGVAGCPDFAIVFLPRPML